jgi:hypothetical protein
VRITKRARGLWLGRPSPYLRVTVLLALGLAPACSAFDEGLLGPPPRGHAGRDLPSAGDSGSGAGSGADAGSGGDGAGNGGSSGGAGAGSGGTAGPDAGGCDPSLLECDGDAGEGCATGYASCDGNDATGCETSIYDVDSCGACAGSPGHQICTELPNVMTSSCAAGSCEIDQCNDGFYDCNGNVDDGCEASADCNAPAAWHRALTIDRTQVAGALTNFPVLVRMTDAAGLGARARADGLDVVFEDDGGNLLPFEIELWDRSSGTLVAWVTLPALDDAADTVIHVVYGDGLEDDRSNTAGVFSNGFRYVWHLSQDPGPGGAGDIKDATGTADATAHSSMTSADLIDAVAGKGIAFDGSNDALTFTNNLTGNGPHTISAWVDQLNDTDGASDTIVSFGGGTTTNQSRFLYAAHATSNNVVGGFVNNDVDSGSSVEAAGWRHVVWTWNGSHSRFYVEGALVSGPTAHTGANTTGTSGQIGNATFGPRFLRGRLDEVRVATVTRSLAWITTEYNNQRPGSSFLSVGPEQAR